MRLVAASGRRGAVNEDTLAKLEFARVRELLAEHCGTSLGKRLARSLTPTTNDALIQEWFTQVRELRDLLPDIGFPPMGGVHDVRAEVRASAFPTPLEADALARIAETLAATAPLSRWFESIRDRAETLGKLGERIHDLSPIAEAIGDAIDGRGQVRDYASPRLASIRATIHDIRERIKHVFDRILRQSSITRMLQYSGATFHDDRMVLPLKAEHRGRVRGIVHRSSDSGSTLFVEPEESVELNNSIIRLRDEESKEITRILRLLTQRVQLNAEAILTTLRTLAVLDLLAGKCRYARKYQCVCPRIDEAGVLDLHEARHPLLLDLFEHEASSGAPARDVVPLDLRLGDDFDVLVITGPNTGGKTVALKTVGLIAAMAQCGIPIPSGEGSRLPVYRDVHIDVGDEQSLQQSLSTFSSHLSNILKILGRSDERTLVLIDELGAGTDPDEGAAMGRAILDELLKLNAKTIVTTHLSTLKAVAFTTPRVDNAAVEFDTETLRPTYRLRIGEPGNSNALIIARRLGMPGRLIHDARRYLDHSTRALNKAIAGTLESKREAERARKAAREAELDAQRQREEFERRSREMHASREAFEGWTRWLRELEPGDEVFLRSLKREGKLVRVQLHRQTALVSAGALEFEVNLDELDRPQ
ncbi:MAG: DNA strand exchange inhibitor protein [Phycisphaerae bacterium]|nr:DNA strand exchange inhibitor protein [Phycisphaerae bacterium]